MKLPAKARPVLLLGALVALVGGGAFAAGPGERGGEAGFFLGAMFTDENLSNETGGTVEPTLGLRGGSVFARRWIWFVDVLASEVPTNDSALGDARTYWGRTGFELIFRPERRSRWFLDGAVGWMNVDFKNAREADFHRPFVSGGFGQRFLLGGRTRLRWEVRGDVTIDDPGLGGETVGQGLLLAGLVWGPRAAMPDEDGDEVPDRRDRCLRTQTGAQVDRRGCPLDGDQDGVPDGIDQCPGTRADVPVDETGCARDSDGDGVHDGTDACPATPTGAVVDDWGCPLDGDRDGVPNGIDRCLRTEPEVLVDSAGCPLDGDADGVPDGLDRCPATPDGVEVGARGCAAAGYEFDGARQTLVLWLNFEASSASLTPAAQSVLDAVLPLVQEGRVEFEIGGHADPDEPDALELSSRRAAVVREYLVDGGADGTLLELHGYGATQVLDDGASAEARRRNRRVELRRLGGSR